MIGLCSLIHIFLNDIEYFFIDLSQSYVYFPQSGYFLLLVLVFLLLGCMASLPILHINQIYDLQIFSSILLIAFSFC